MLFGKRFRAGLIYIIALLHFPVVPNARAESLESTFVRLAEKIPFVNYGDLFYQRKPRREPHDPRIEIAASGLNEAMATTGDLNEFSRLAEHSNPRVRMLALIRLYCMEQPEAFIAIQRRMSDNAETFPYQSVPLGLAPEQGIPLVTESRTVGSWATWMMEQVGFPGDWNQSFDQWKVGRIGNPDWIRWHAFLYQRASGGTSPLPAEYAQRVVALKKRMESASPAVRAWLWFGLADDALSVPRYDTAMASKEEMLNAGKELGSAALLAFLRDGGRAGLREPKVDDPSWGRRSILSNGGELFREEDATALAEMGHFVTAADANPAMASRWIRDALASKKKGFSDSWDRARAVAALVDLRGDEEADYVVKWFYEAPVNDSQSSDQGVFFSELRRRDPKQWRGTFHKIVEHPGFEKLAELDVIYAALAVNQFSGSKVVPDEMRTSGWEHEIRNILREYFGLPVVRHQRLESAKSPAKVPLWSVGLDANVYRMVLSPDGKIIALEMRNGGVRLFDAESGRDLGTLETDGFQFHISFRKSDGQLLVVESGALTTWDVLNRRIVSKFTPQSGRWDECAIDLSGSLLANRESGGAMKGVALYDLPSGRLRWLFPIAIRGSGDIAFSNDGQRLVASDAFSHDLHLFDSASPTPISKLTGHSDVPIGAWFSPDGRWLATLGSGKIMLWDGRSGELRNQFLIRWMGSAFVFSDNSKEFVTRSDFNQMTRYDLVTGRALSGYEIQTAFVSKILESDDGERIFILLNGPVGSNLPMVGGATIMRGAQVKEGEKPVAARLECWKR